MSGASFPALDFHKFCKNPWNSSEAESEMEGIYLPEINGIPLNFKVSATFPVEDLERFETLRDP